MVIQNSIFAHGLHNERRDQTVLRAADIIRNDSFQYLYYAEQAHLYCIFMLIIRLAIETLDFLQRKYWLYHLTTTVHTVKDSPAV